MLTTVTRIEKKRGANKKFRYNHKVHSNTLSYSKQNSSVAQLAIINMTSNTIYDDLYQACQTGDFATVKRLLPLLSFEDIHHRVESIEDFGMVPSLLAVAWSSKNDHIAMHLIDHGVMRKMTTKRLLSTNAQNRASSHENQQYVVVPSDTYHLRDRVFIDASSEEPFEWISEQYAHVAPLNRSRMSNHEVITAAESILNDPRFRDIPSIQWYLKKACETENPEYLIKTYTLPGEFYMRLNEALAKDTNLGIGMNITDRFSGIYLYVGCLLNNNYLKKFRYSGRAYRGMRLDQKYFETNYILHRKIMIRSFTSTSKSREVAEVFADASHLDEKVAVLYIFTIPYACLQT